MMFRADASAERSGTDVRLRASARLSNDDIKPVEQQSWSVYNLFAMWMSNVHSVAGYVFAASLFTLGLGGWQVFSALVVGITLIYFFTNLAGRAGQKYGIPFAAACRSSFGVFGANIPSMIKAITAMCWYGIQTWVASTALVVVVLRFFPGLEPMTKDSILGMSSLGWICFLVMWLSQLLVFYFGWEAIRRFTDWAGPAVYVVMFLLAGWIIWRAGGEISFSLGSKHLTSVQTWGMWLTAVAFTVAWFAGTTLNFADFARFIESPRSMRRGNFLGLPLNFTLFALAAVVTTSGGLSVFHELITDPVELVARIDNVTAVLLGALTFMIATIATNIVANFVSAAMDLANLLPKQLNFRRAGVVASVVSVLVMPWKLYADAQMVQYTLGTLGSFIGPIFGIVIVDFFVVRRQYIDIEHIYSDDPRGRYWYTRGFNRRAIAALLLAGGVSCSVALIPFFSAIAPFSWFVGAACGAVFYLALMRSVTSGIQQAEPEPS
ncbi:NCS1 family nucleobase:cation symporter-1 [Streptomyces sp. NPDC056190]|uniref:NCS1 family nucleobase:cation symporter-1 n=1 Tax=Streptomyces sp. NPDC056190 TaxID=3345741 RepID=UPI0035D96CEC